MHIGVCIIRLQVFDGGSLKDKRRVVRGIKDRTRQRYNVAIAEVDCLDDRRNAELGITCVSNDSRHADSMLTKVADYIEGSFPVVVLNVERELWTI
jgi:uncharacterized protein YlxP (DUF503 family)